MKRKTISATLILCLSLIACDSQNESNPESQTLDSSLTQTTMDINSFISIFEIPATDISRAVDFYQTILSIEIEKMEMEGMKMGVFPYENQLVSAVIVEGEGYQPSTDGVTIYLNGGDDLQIVLDKIDENGGEILVPKTAHADESGYFALFLDSEGNRIGLHSVN